MKKFFKFALASIVAVSAGVGVSQNMLQENFISDLALENIEALADNSENGTAVGICYLKIPFSEYSGFKLFCDDKTSSDRIYPCPDTVQYGGYNEMSKDRCTK